VKNGALISLRLSQLGYHFTRLKVRARFHIAATASPDFPMWITSL